MKKTIIWCVSIFFIATCICLGFIFKYDIIYATSSLRRIKIDKSIDTQSIMTFNIRNINDSDKKELSWKYRASLICDILQETQPSIICMQENKEKQYQFFKKFLKGYDSVATHRDTTTLSECLPIFYRKDIYELVESHTFWLSDTPETISNTWNAEYFRICTFVVLKNKNTNKQFIVGNTHLDYKSQEIQTKSIQLIYDRLNTFNLPTIIMGDFNCTPDSKAIALAKQHFVDVGQGFEDETKGTINYFKEEYPNVKIDFMLQINGSFTIKKYKVINKKIKNHYASDHFPIYAEIE